MLMKTTKLETGRRAITRVLVMTMILAASAGAAFAYANSVTYSGQGLIADGFGGYDLRTELCGIANGAEVDGPYILWILTANKAANADITGPWGTAAMTKFGNGVFKYVSQWYDPATLPGNVTGTYDGAAKNAQLVISHGCRPFEEGAWCSPGFWRNASDGAWALTGYSRAALFNETVYDSFHGASYATDPSLQTVLGNPQIYSGAPTPGTLGHPLNAFNATGAFLTSQIPGFTFDFDVMQAGGSNACPIDHHGNYK
jgi:hypothetical protein